MKSLRVPVDKLSILLNGLTRYQIIAILITIFVLAHAVYYSIGLRFDAGLLEQAYQLLDLRLLQNRLLESLFYLHSQPPLYNLFVGLMLQLFPKSSYMAFWFVNLVSGFFLYAGIFLLMRIIGISRLCSLTIVSSFLWTPSFVLYENWLFYTFPLTLVIVWSAVALYYFVKHPRYLYGTLFCSCLSILCLTQALFHLIFYIFAILILVWSGVISRRRVLICAALPFLLVLALYIKNGLVFGQFTASTWLGSNFALNRLTGLSAEERQSLVEKGVLSDAARYNPFTEAIDKYPPRYQDVGRFASIPALSDQYKSSGYPNFNHLGFIGVSKQYMSDTVMAQKIHPRLAIAGPLMGWRYYFYSSSDYAVFMKQDHRILFLVENLNRWIYWRVPGKHMCLTHVIMMPVLIIYSLGFLRRARAMAAPVRIALIYILFIILFVALCSNFLNASENNRIRFMTDPFYAVLLALFIQTYILPRFSKLFQTVEPGMTNGGAVESDGKVAGKSCEGSLCCHSSMCP